MKKRVAVELSEIEAGIKRLRSLYPAEYGIGEVSAEEAGEAQPAGKESSPLEAKAKPVRMKIGKEEKK